MLFWVFRATMQFRGFVRGVGCLLQSQNKNPKETPKTSKVPKRMAFIPQNARSIGRDLGYFGGLGRRRRRKMKKDANPLLDDRET